MDILSQIEKALSLNQNLTEAIKTNILELVIIFNKNFSEIKLDSLLERLKTLKIEKLNKFLNHDVSMYDFRSNILYFNPKEIDNGYDAKLVMMFEILNMITSTHYQMGFNTNNKYEALNVGYTAVLANYLVGNEGEKQLYPTEAVVANLLTVVAGDEVFKEAYFTNNHKLIIDKLESMGVNI